MTTPEHQDLLDGFAEARNAVLRSVDGLSDEQLGATPTVSALCLGGLVKHLTVLENRWAKFIPAGPDATEYPMPDGVTWDDIIAGTAREFPQWAIDYQNAFRMLPGDTGARIAERYRAAAAATDAAIVAAADLSKRWPLPEAPWNPPGMTRSIRGTVLHAINETAQHAGHGDIIREALNAR